MGNPCYSSQCLENGPPQGRYRLWRKAAARLRSEATGPQGEETWPKYRCRMPSMWPHLCVQLQDVFSPTASKTSLLLAMDYHEQKVKYSEHKNKQKVKYNSKELTYPKLWFWISLLPSPNWQLLHKYIHHRVSRDEVSPVVKFFWNFGEGRNLQNRWLSCHFCTKKFQALAWIRREK